MTVFIITILTSIMITLFCWSIPQFKISINNLFIRMYSWVYRDVEIKENQIWIGLGGFRFYVAYTDEFNYVIWCTNTKGISTISRETKDTWNHKRKFYSLYPILSFQET